MKTFGPDLEVYCEHCESKTENDKHGHCVKCGSLRTSYEEKIDNGFDYSLRRYVWVSGKWNITVEGIECRRPPYRNDKTFN